VRRRRRLIWHTQPSPYRRIPQASCQQGSLECTLDIVLTCPSICLEGSSKHTLAQSAYLDSIFGIDEELPRAGSALENPYVFDASARELKAMAAEGLLDIVEEHTRGCR
jgi:hypothetical protein